MSFLKADKTINDIEEEREKEAAQVSLLEQRVLRKELEGRLGSGATGNFREGGKINWQRIKNWLKTH